MTENTRDVFEWITLVIAVGGAVLSVVNFINDLVRRRPHIKVYFRRGFQTVGFGETIDTRIIEVVNVGEIPVVITQLGVYVNRKRSFVPVASKFADGTSGHKRLEPGETCSAYLSGDECAAPAMAHPTRAFARIATHKEFASDRIDENLNEVAKRMYS